MICVENDLLKEIYDKQFEEGYRYAYLYPGIARVLQAAGRVIRSETDKGAVLLIDSRWYDREHRSLLPQHWQIYPVYNEQQMKNRLEAFYEGFLAI